MLVEKNKCSGCSACYSVCPKNAIKMEKDEEGFLYPVIDESLCVNCELCERVCSSLNAIIVDLQKTYAAISLNEEARMHSSSGGIFYELAMNTLSNGGYVCGAAFDENNQVHHVIINNVNDLDKIMRSKYVQSRIENVMKEIKKLLISGNKVLFVGTPCQVNGLKLFLNKDYDNLLTCDIICHGTPSPKLWETYLEYIKNNHDINNITNINFRDKTSGWSNFSININEYSRIHQEDLFYISFLSNYCLRSSCYNCKCSGSNRYSDITLSDFWGFENFDLKLKHMDKGLSLLVINTNKGLDIINSLNNIQLEEVSSDALKYNSSYSTSVKKPLKRDEYMTNINSENFKVLTLKYTHIRVSLVRRIIRRIKRKFKKILHIK